MQQYEKPRTIGNAAFGPTHVKDFFFSESFDTITSVSDDAIDEIPTKSFANWLSECRRSPGEFMASDFQEQCRVIGRYLEEMNAALERRYLRLFSSNED